MKFNSDDLTTKQVYKLLTGSVVPRPIAWVSTISQDGVYNLAPFSFFTVASRNPPTLCLSIGEGMGERDGTTKDTLANIRDQKEFVINVVPSALGHEMVRSAENVAPDVDEIQATRLTPVASDLVQVPRIKESPIQMECVLSDIIPIGSDHLVLGRMVHFHIDDDYYIEPHKVDVEKLRPLARLAGNYANIEGIFEINVTKGK